MPRRGRSADAVSSKKLTRLEPSEVDAINKVWLILGRRGTGKSTLLKDLLYHFSKQVEDCVCISGTEESNSFFGSMIPDLFIYNEYKPQIIEKCIERQKEKAKRGTVTNMLIIMDDCFYDNSIGKDKSLRQIFMNGRHYKITLFCCLQYYASIPPALRVNTDYLAITCESTPSNRQILYNSFFGCCPTFEVFNDIMNRCTEGYKVLVLRNGQDSDVSKCIFWYVADNNVPEYKIGSYQYWKAGLTYRKRPEDCSNELTIR